MSGKSLGRTMDLNGREILLTAPEAFSKYGEKAEEMEWVCGYCDVPVKFHTRECDSGRVPYFALAKKNPGHSKECQMQQKTGKLECYYSNKQEDIDFSKLAKVYGIGIEESGSSSAATAVSGEVDDMASTKIIECVPGDIYASEVRERRSLHALFMLLRTLKEFNSGGKVPVTLNEAVINAYNFDDFFNEDLKVNGPLIVPCVRRGRDQNDSLFDSIVHDVGPENPRDIILVRSVYDASFVFAIDISKLSPKRKAQFRRKFFCLSNNKPNSEKTESDLKKEENLRKQRALCLFFLDWKDMGSYGDCRVAYGKITKLKALDFMTEKAVKEENNRYGDSW